MTDILAGIHFSTPATQVLGAVGGALLGAFGTFLIGQYVRKQQLTHIEMARIRKQIDKNTEALIMARSNINHLLLISFANIESATKMTKGIYDSQTGLVSFVPTLPIPLQVKQELSGSFLNVNLMVQWDSLETQTILQNATITQFTDYYSSISTNMRTAGLTKLPLDMKTILLDNRTIIASADQLIKAFNYYRQQCIEVLAGVECNADILTGMSFKNMSLEDLLERYHQLILYEPHGPDVRKK